MSHTDTIYLCKNDAECKARSNKKITQMVSVKKENEEEEEEKEIIVNLLRIIRKNDFRIRCDRCYKYKLSSNMEKTIFGDYVCINENCIEHKDDCIRCSKCKHLNYSKEFKESK
jgi:hypothetical protein